MLRWTALCLCIACAVMFGAASEAEQRAEVLICNGRVMHAAGNPWLRADIAIQGDRIVAIGVLRGATALRVIDAADRLVTPGFIDVHSHAAEDSSIGGVAIDDAKITDALPGMVLRQQSAN